MIEFTINFEKNSPNPLYIQLYEYIKDGIQMKKIISGCKLPSVRKLSNHLKISKNTIEMAYYQLELEGYIESKPRKGFYVKEIDTSLSPNLKNKHHILDVSFKNKSENYYKYDFRNGQIDTDHFPYAIWRNLTNKCIHPDEKSLLTYGDPQGEIGLRTEISKYIFHSRGVFCSPEQVIITPGTQYSLDLLCKMLSLRKKCIAIEDPGYPKVRFIFEINGFEVEPISLDSTGINLNKLKKSDTEIVYISPAHQFPYGMVMPIDKRMEILKWAEENNGLIIEDDYEGEFGYHGRPIPSLQGFESNGKVVYLYTFSSSFLPAIRLSFMVLPIDLLEIYKEKFTMFQQAVSKIHQKTLQLFMEKGYWEKHIRKMKNIYKKRWF